MKFRSLLLSLLMCMVASLSAVANEEFVTYEEFGAKGDGKTNDHPAIVKAHAHANEKGLPVKAKRGAVYYIGDCTEAAIVKTDTDFSGARFIIDDVALNFDNRRVELFLVEPDKPSYLVEIVGGLPLNTKQLNRTFDTPVLLNLWNKNVKHFIRWGTNQNDGTAQSDLVLVDKDGVIDKSTPLCWEFAQVTAARAYPIDDKPITIQGGEFITIANQAESKYNYYARGFRVRRSNVTMAGIVHLVQREMDQGAPYSGFFSVENCANVVLKDLVVTGHKSYSTIGSAGKPVLMGSYDLSANHAINVSFLNIRQSNDICDTRLWGVLGSNFCKNLLYDHCRLSRFDAHQGVCNATIRNSELGHQGVNLIGYGLFLLENTVVHNNCLIYLRVDYGAFWRGNILIRNCTLVPRDKNCTPCIISGNYTGKHDFGYQCFMPNEVRVNGLKIMDGAGRKYNGPCVFDNFNYEFKPGYVEKYPYVRTQRVILQNVVTESGMKVQKALKPEFFTTTQVEAR